MDRKDMLLKALGSMELRRRVYYAMERQKTARILKAVRIANPNERVSDILAKVNNSFPLEEQFEEMELQKLANQFPI